MRSFGKKLEMNSQRNNENLNSSISLFVIREEVREGLKRLRNWNRKASGPRGVCAELLKYGGVEVIKMLTNFINSILKGGNITQEIEKYICNK